MPVPDRRARNAAWPWLSAAATLALLLLIALAVERPRVLVDREGAFGRVRVVEDGGLRTLYTGAGRARQSVVRPGDPLHLALPYTRVATIGLALVPPDARILYVGLGGGAMPMHAHHVLARASIDVVELDPLIIEVAQEFFDVAPDSLLRVHAGDGRAFIESAAPATWDLIVLDAFSDDAIPRALATREFLAAVRSRLRPGGVVLSNLWASNDAYASMLATYQDVFGVVHLLRVPGRRQRVLVAGVAPRVLDRAALVGAARSFASAPALGFDLVRLVERGYEAVPAVRAPVLADSVPTPPGAARAPASRTTDVLSAASPSGP